MSENVEINIVGKDNFSAELHKARVALEELRLQLLTINAEENPEKVAQLTTEYDKLAASIKKSEGELDSLDKKQGMTLKSFGENLRNVGIGLTVGLTAPLIGLGSSIISSVSAAGKDAADVVKKVQDNIDKDIKAKQVALGKAIAGKDVEKIAAATWDLSNAQKSAQQQMNAISPSVKNLASSWNEVQAALDPLREQLKGIESELLQAFVPLLQQAIPLLKDVVTWVGGIVKGFVGMGPAGKIAVAAIVGMFIAVGPVLTILGQLAIVLGSIGPAGAGAAGGLAVVKGGLAGIAGFFGPITLLIGAVAALLTLLNSDFGKSGIEAGKKLLALGVGNLGTLVTGDAARGQAATLRASQALGVVGSSGTVSPGNGGGAAPVVVNYAPMISTADTQQAVQALQPIIALAQRTQAGR